MSPTLIETTAGCASRPGNKSPDSCVTCSGDQRFKQALMGQLAELAVLAVK